MLNVKPFLVRFARNARQETEKVEKGLQGEGALPDPPPPDTIFTRVRPETTDEN